MSEITITKANFEDEVLRSEKPVLVDFWASWCGPCKMLAPVLHEFADEHAELKVGKVNVDEEMDLAMRFGVSSIPTLILFKNGEAVKTTVGFLPKAQLESFALENYNTARGTPRAVFLCAKRNNILSQRRFSSPGEDHRL